MDSTRLFVGNLPADTKENDLTEKFSPYGKILKVELKERKFLQPPSCFAFITMGASKHSLQTCLYDLSDGYAWNNHPVTVDFAKESFLSRLAKERLDPRNKNIIIDIQTTNTDNRSPSLKHSEKKIVNVALDKKNVSNKQNCSDSESIDSESSESSENDSNKPETFSKTVLTENGKIKKFNENTAKAAQRTVSNKSESSDSEASSKSDSDSDKQKLTSVHKPVQKTNKVVTNSSIAQSKQQKSISESDSDEEINVNKLAQHSNDVMKQFEQFSSVWQDTSEDEANHSDSSDEIFEAFKIKPTEKSECKQRKPFSNDKQSFSVHDKGFSNKQLFPEGSKGNFSNSKESPDCNKSSDFVQFVKTRQPQVLSKTETKLFSEVKVSSFPKFERNSKKIIFDVEHGLHKSVNSQKPLFSRSAEFQKQETNPKPSDSKMKISKPQAKNHVDAENKRRNAMEERIKEIADKRKAIKQALSNVDLKKGSTINKKIIFSLNSDDEEPGANPTSSHLLQSSQNHRHQELKLTNGMDIPPTKHRNELDIRVSGKHTSRQLEWSEREGKTDKKSLFDESEDDSVEEEFQIKKQFEGEKGLKLLELQASYNNDIRFNLDDRFAEDETNELDKDKEVEENEGVSEKEKQMQILENVLGYKVKQHQTKNGLLTIPRFDPLNPDSKSLLQVKAKSTRDPNDRKRRRKPRDAPVAVSDEKFYQLDEVYFNTKQDTQNVDEPFSLLKMLNRDTNDEVPDNSGASSQNFPSSRSGQSDEYRVEPLVSSNPFASMGARFEYDSSDSEEDEVRVPLKRSRRDLEEDKAGAKSAVEERAGQFGRGLAPPPIEKMFFLKDDDRFKEAREFLRKAPSSGVDGFKMKRRELALKLKTKVRRNMKNSSLASNMKRRKKSTKMMKTQKRR